MNVQPTLNHGIPCRTFGIWTSGTKPTRFSIDVHKTLQRNKRVDAHLRSQLSRAARSIPSNLVEGCGTNSQAELARYAGMSISSSSEAEYWILFARDVGYFPASDFERLTSSTVEVRRSCSASAKR
jgi:four helix bundle protein